MKTSKQEWIDKRIEEVNRHYSAFDALIENGVEIVDELASQQLFCPFHENTRTPAARYYASSGKDSHFYCWGCKTRLNGIGLFAKFKGIQFMEALSRLERRYSIDIPEIPEFQEIEISGRNHTYKSVAWADVNRVTEILESKLLRLRNKIGFTEYVKFCRFIDRIVWDFESNDRKITEEMNQALKKAMSMMDDALFRNEIV